MQRLVSDEGLRRRGKAYKNARHLLEADGPATAATIRTALLNYIADRCNVPAAGLTRAEALDLLGRRVVSPKAVRAVDSLLLSLEQEEFGGGNGQILREGAAAARNILDQLERCRSL